MNSFHSTKLANRKIILSVTMSNVKIAKKLAVKAHTRTIKQNTHILTHTHPHTHSHTHTHTHTPTLTHPHSHTHTLKQ